jgi:hypothetical protein
MFLHAENQQLLWQTLQKSPYLVEFTQKFAGYREAWFRSVSEQFYLQWISSNSSRVPTNARELLEINKQALQFMVTDLKRMLGYGQNSGPTTNISNANIPIIPTYNVAEERQQREDKWSTDFNKFQSEYNRLLERPALPMRGLTSESGDEKIKNMDELLQQHAKMRDMDLSIYSPPPNTPNTPKLKIMDELERLDIEEKQIKSVHWSNSSESIETSEYSGV